MADESFWGEAWSTDPITSVMPGIMAALIACSNTVVQACEPRYEAVMSFSTTRAN